MRLGSTWAAAAATTPPLLWPTRVTSASPSEAMGVVHRINERLVAIAAPEKIESKHMVARGFENRHHSLPRLRAALGSGGERLAVGESVHAAAKERDCVALTGRLSATLKP